MCVCVWQASYRTGLCIAWTVLTPVYDQCNSIYWSTRIWSGFIRKTSQHAMSFVHLGSVGRDQSLTKTSQTNMFFLFHCVFIPAISYGILIPNWLPQRAIYWYNMCWNSLKLLAMTSQIYVWAAMGTTIWGSERRDKKSSRKSQLLVLKSPRGELGPWRKQWIFGRKAAKSLLRLKNMEYDLYHSVYPKKMLMQSYTHTENTAVPGVV